MKSRKLKYSTDTFLALQGNGKHQLASKHALRIYKSNAIYTFIPKNACSTLRYSIAYANGCIDNEIQFNWIHNNNSTFSADLPSLITADYAFVIIRCPFRRLASVYLDKIVGSSNAAWKLQAADPQGSRNYIEPISFYQFVKKVALPGIKNLDIHWRPQNDFLVYKEYDDYFCLESFQDAALILKEKIDLDIYDARKLAGHGLEQYEKMPNIHNAFNLNSQEIKSLQLSGKCPTIESLYNDELMSIVNKIYADDVALFKDAIGNDKLLFS